MSLFTDTITNTASLNHFYQDVKYESRRFCSSQSIHQIETARHAFLHQLDKSIDRLPTLSTEDLQALLQAKNSGKLPVFFDTFLDLSQQDLLIEQEHRFWFHGLPKQASKFISAVFPLAWTVFGLVNSYNSFSVLIPNEGLNWIISATTNFPYLFLELTLARSLVNHVYDLVVGRYFGTFHANLPQQLYPKSYTLALCWGLFTTANAFGSRANFVTSEITGEKGIFLAIVVCISTVAYKSAAMMDIIKMSFEHYAKRHGDEKAKELVILVHAMQHFSRTIHDADPLKLQLILDQMQGLTPDEAKTGAEQRRLPLTGQSNYASFWQPKQRGENDLSSSCPSCAIL